MFGDKIQDYEILELLGKGGFAHVHRARCMKTGHYVAIKMIDKSLMVSAGMISRVRQEVNIHSRLKHPAILELYTFFEDLNYVYLVLELAHNGELAKHFKLGTRGLSEKAAADIFKQVVSGVLYLHTHNIIHRDLSLNNLLLTKDLNVKIADFGLATQLNGPDEKHVTMCGTPNYISPEVASRELHGLPADVWGLGCMLYTLLVGKPPFHTQHVKTTLNRVINADYKIPSDLSHVAQDILQKLLCKDPQKRITLRQIMDHPFLNNIHVLLHKQEYSRDSGFLTTLHSTQQSTKLKIDDKAMHHYNEHRNEVSDYESKNSKQGASFNLFQDVPAQLNALAINRLENNMGNHHTPSGNRVLENLLQSKYTETSSSHLFSKDSVKKLESKPNSMNSESKENIKSSNIMSVPPLCADRLPAISHKTRNAILKIEPTCVIVEFIKKKGKNREEKVAEVCKISKDGMKIVIYAGDKVKEYQNDNEYFGEVFSYHNLPEKHWKKYLYASRFVDLVKAKTPKVTLYSTLAKCQMMENGTDFEMFFYSGEKLTYTASDGLKVIDKCLKTHHEPKPDSDMMKHLIDHFEECSNKIKRVHSALSCIPDDCFPLIIGKRPVTAHKNVISSPYQDSANFNTPILNIPSFRATHSRAQSDYM